MEKGKVMLQDMETMGDWDHLKDRSRADTEDQVRRLADRIMAEVEQDLEAEGESRSPEQWEGLEWGARVIAEKVYDVAEPIFYVSPLDTGVGKTLLVIAAIRVILADPTLTHFSIVLFISRRELVDELLKRIGIAPGDPRLAVYFAQTNENFRWNSLGVGSDRRLPGTKKLTRRRKRDDGTWETEPNPNYVPPPQNKAQLLITSQGLLKSRSRWGPNFAANDLWQYHSAPRALRIWDEASPPADGITLTVGQMTTYASNLPAGEQAEVLRWVEAVLQTQNDTAILVPDWSEPLAKILRKQPKGEGETDERTRSTLLGLSGKLVRVLRDDYYKATVITYSNTLPYNLAPMLILDAGADEKEVYREWERRRGNLVIGPSGRKECPIIVKHWDRAAGRAEHRTPAKKAELVEGAVAAYREALAMGADRVLLVTFKPDKPSYDIEQDMRDRLYELGIDDTPLVAITWGGETTATNAFKDVRYQIQVGQFQLPMKDYVAMQRGAAGVLDREPFDMERAHAVRRSEVASSYDQALGRGAARKLKDGKCSEPIYVWAIFSQRGKMGISRQMLRRRSDSHVEAWHPLGVRLRPTGVHSEKLETFAEKVLLPRAGGSPFTEAELVAEGYSPSTVYRFLRKPEVKAWLLERGWGLRDKTVKRGRRQGALEWGITAAELTSGS